MTLDLIDISVREVPREDVTFLTPYAQRNGIPRSAGATARWAIIEYAKRLRAEVQEERGPQGAEESAKTEE